MRKIGFLIAIFFIALAGNITAQTDYGIYIAGVKVTSANCDSITGAKISGSVSYNDDTKTLALDDATIEGSIDFDFPPVVEDITITLVGENTMAGYIESVSGTKTINGHGSLKVEYIGNWYEQNTIIENCTIEIVAATAGYEWGKHGPDSKLTIKNANLSSEAFEVAIGSFKDIELIGCEIVEPANAQIIDNEFDGEKGKYICDGDGNIAKKVVIKKSATTIDYGITIANVKVTSDNCNNITGVGITGSVSYNHETKTLTLDNATINGNISFGTTPNIIEDITITLVGENTVIGYINPVSDTKTINGTGSLKVEYINNWHEKNSIIEDCTIEIVAGEGYWALYGEGDNSKLTIRSANLSSEGMVAIGSFKDIELVDCEIVEPVNAQIIDNEFEGIAGKFICNEDGTIAKKVVIKKLSGLNDIAQTNNINIYPNPARNKVTIEGKGEIVITNSLGQVVKEIKDNNTYRTLNIKDFEKGVYYIKVGDTTQQLVVE